MRSEKFSEDNLVKVWFMNEIKNINHLKSNQRFNCKTDWLDLYSFSKIYVFRLKCDLFNLKSRTNWKQVEKIRKSLSTAILIFPAISFFHPLVSCFMDCNVDGTRFWNLGMISFHSLISCSHKSSTLWW